MGAQRGYASQVASCARFNNFLSYQLTCEIMYPSASDVAGGVELEPVELKRETDLSRDGCQFYALFFFHLIHLFVHEILDISFCLLASFPNHLISSLSFWYDPPPNHLLLLTHLILLFLVGLGVVQFLSRNSRLISGKPITQMGA